MDRSCWYTASIQEERCGEFDHSAPTHARHVPRRRAGHVSWTAWPPTSRSSASRTARPIRYEDITNDQSNAPTALRAASSRIVRSLERYDFDLGGPLYAGRAIRAVDCGDIRSDLGDPAAHSRRTEQAVRAILAAGALPIVLGGDHGVPIPVLRAFEGRGPITLVQIDQHIDWRDEVNGVREGLSSPIRRASEMAHIGQIFQIGLRATGSARQEEVDAALAYGAHLIPAWELHEIGMDAVLALHS